MLEQISYLGKFWFLRYGPKCSWPIRLQDFFMNHRTLKLAVSHKEKFSRKSHFWPQFGPKGPEWAQNRVLGFFEKFCDVSFSWK